MTTQNTITLAGTPYEVSPLKVKQAKIVLPAFSRCNGAFESADSIDCIRDIIFGALFDGYPQITLDALDDMVITPTEMLVAVGVIMKVSGLQEAKAAIAQGEAQAVAAAKKQEVEKK